jgi:hypothetical protein
MGGNAFTVGLLLGGFLIASWVDAKVGDARPGTPAKRLAHAVAGVLALEGSVGLLYVVQAATPSQPVFLVAVFALFLPALTYALLAGLWVLRMLAELAHIAGR